MARNDILVNEDGSLRTLNGDFVVGESDVQHIRDILESRPGDWKQHPTLGCGIMDRLKGTVDQEFMKKLTIQLQSDGYDINDVAIDFGTDENS